MVLFEAAALLGGYIIKRYKDKVVLAKRPVKRKKKPTPLQERRQDKMREAVHFAQHINADPVKKAAWKKHAKGYSNVYQAVIAWYSKHGNARSPFMPPAGQPVGKKVKARNK